MFSRRSPIAKLETELVDLTRRRTDLETRLAQARATADTATAERRRFLVETDGADARAFSKIEAACRDAADRVAGLEDAVTTVADRISTTEAAITDAKAKADRERVANQIDDGAEAIDKAARNLREAMKATGQAYAALRQALRSGGFRLGDHVDAESFAKAALAEGIEMLDPGFCRSAARMFIQGYGDPAETVRKIQTDEARRLADAVRSGTMPIAALPSRLTPVMPEFSPGFRIQRVVLKRPIKWRAVGGGWEMASDICSVPAPVAATALAQDLAHTDDSPEGRAAIAERNGGPQPPSRLLDGNPVHLTWGECHDIGVDLARERAKEIERLEAEWRAEHPEAA
ncbi:hypothetical protein [Salinarimonas soli]|uniref:Uncharacterized protein n=1 Tax=Salinarimonas soli TaxID=1638099 RepID=A0A5B2VF65_9HYPH|nr:hypothetical protein [Salinarimonas soli]KAA2236949.1 hypothetical protein F0L46_11800 [Salinarimonas soli]